MTTAFGGSEAHALAASSFPSTTFPRSEPHPLSSFSPSPSPSLLPFLARHVPRRPHSRPLVSVNHPVRSRLVHLANSVWTCELTFFGAGASSDGSALGSSSTISEEHCKHRLLAQTMH